MATYKAPDFSIEKIYGITPAEAGTSSDPALPTEDPDLSVDFRDLIGKK